MLDGHRAPGEPVTLETVIRAHDRLVQTIERSEFASVLNVLMSGDEGEVNEVRALQLLADRGGDTSPAGRWLRCYGFSSHSRVRPALVRLQGRGLVDQRDGAWYIVDPALRRMAATGVATGRSTGDTSLMCTGGAILICTVSRYNLFLMHVGLNLVFLVPGETGGMEVAARELIPALVEAAPDVRFTAFVNREAAAAKDGPWGELLPAVTVPVNARNRVQWVVGEQALLPRLAAREGVDLVHSLASTAPPEDAFAGSSRSTT